MVTVAGPAPCLCKPMPGNEAAGGGGCCCTNLPSRFPPAHAYTPAHEPHCVIWVRGLASMLDHAACTWRSAVCADACVNWVAWVCSGQGFRWRCAGASHATCHAWQCCTELVRGAPWHQRCPQAPCTNNSNRCRAAPSNLPPVSWPARVRYANAMWAVALHWLLHCFPPASAVRVPESLSHRLGSQTRLAVYKQTSATHQHDSARSRYAVRLSEPHPASASPLSQSTDGASVQMSSSPAPPTAYAQVQLVSVPSHQHNGNGNAFTGSSTEWNLVVQMEREQSERLVRSERCARGAADADARCRPTLAAHGKLGSRPANKSGIGLRCCSVVLAWQCMPLASRAYVVQCARQHFKTTGAGRRRPHLPHCVSAQAPLQALAAAAHL